MFVVLELVAFFWVNGTSDFFFLSFVINGTSDFEV